MPLGDRDHSANARRRSKKYCYDQPRPAVTVDIVVVRSKEPPEVLLIKRAREPFKGLWALPGGFVNQDESLELAAARELFEETGLERLRLAQVGAFGDPGRDPRGHTVSVAFAGLIRADGGQQVRAGDDAAEARWWPAGRLPRLAFDHRKIVRAALQRL